MTIKKNKYLHMKLRIGDKVRFLNEVGEGVITRFKDKETVFVEMQDGFEIPYLCKHLVPIHTELILNPEVENMEMELETILSDSIYFIIELCPMFEYICLSSKFSHSVWPQTTWQSWFYSF